LLRIIGVIIALVLACTVLALFAERLPPTVARAVPFLIPMIGFTAIAWLIWENKKSASD
jgi:multidrug transporter EmrE-like cation transporter